MTRLLTPRSAAAAALLAFCTPGAAAAQVIAGRVIDAASGAGVPRAIVTAEGGPPSPRTLSDDDGRFVIALGEVGSYRVRVAREGYRDARTRPLTPGPRDTVAVDVRVTAVPVALRALEVTARRRRLDVIGDFRQMLPADSILAGPVTASGRQRGISVKGTFPTPSVCYHLAGAADRIGQVVMLNVEARPTGSDLCPDAEGAFTYSVTLRELPPGTYTLRVLHTFRNNAWEPEMALDTTVTVR
jgi:hypothetical protein